MTDYFERAHFHINCAIMTPLQAGIIIGAMVVVAAVALAIILRQCRVADKRIEAARSQASSADALAKAVDMLDKMQNSGILSKTDETSVSSDHDNM